MAKYRVARGHTWGVDRLPAETVIELAEVDAAMFVPWKLVPLETAQDAPERAKVAVVDLSTLMVPQQKPGPTTEADVEDADLPDLVEWEDLPDRLIDLLEDADIDPSELSGMTDEDILAISGVGPKYLADIREHYPKE